MLSRPLFLGLLALSLNKNFSTHNYLYKIFIITATRKKHPEAFQHMAFLRVSNTHVVTAIMSTGSNDQQFINIQK